MSEKFPPKTFLVAPWGEAFEESSETLDDVKLSFDDTDEWERLISVKEHEALLAAAASRIVALEQEVAGGSWQWVKRVEELDHRLAKSEAELAETKARLAVAVKTFQEIAACGVKEQLLGSDIPPKHGFIHMAGLAREALKEISGPQQKDLTTKQE